LHFEIRDKENQPVNPFHHSFNLPDSLYPEAEYLAVIPLDNKAQIDGFQEQKIYTLTKLSNGKYVLPDTIFVSGNIGFAIKALDKINDQYFNFGIYSANLLLDATFIYSMQYDIINWENASKIYTEKNYSLARSGQGKFYNLFSNHGNESLPFINSKSKSGYYFDQKTPHDAIIDIYDFAQNKTEIHAYFVSDTLPNFTYTADFIDNECIVTFKDQIFYRPQFNLTGTRKNDKIFSTEYYDFGNNTYKIKNISPPFNVLQISAKNKKGISSPPTFHMKATTNFDNINGDFKIKHYEHGIIISFTEDFFSGLNAFLILKRNGTLHKYSLHRNSKLTLSSNLLSPSNLKDIDELSIYYDISNPYEIYKMSINGDIIFPDSSFRINLLDNKIILKGNPNTFYDTTYIWAKNVKTTKPIDGKIINKPFYIKPSLIPFNQEVELIISVDLPYIDNKIGIYTYNQKKFSWEYLPSKIISDSLYISTSILSGEIFAIIEENTPPVLSNLIPNINGTYYSSDIEYLSFNVEDKLSGLNGEDDIIVKLDNNTIIFEYNSYQNKIRYPLKYNLKKGTHTLYVQASDKVGNRSIIKGQFYIK